MPLPLRDWMKRNRWTITAIAAELGLESTYMGRIVSRKAQPSLTVAARIERFTGGEVKAADLDMTAPAPTAESAAA